MTASPSDNPLLQDWRTPFAIPPFAAFAVAHLEPAFTAALAMHCDEIDAITANPEPATFENTVLALEASGDRLSKVAATFWVLAGADTNPQLQKLERELGPRVTAHFNAITSNAELFARLDAVHAKRDQLALTDEQRQLLKRQHRGFVRAGAALDRADKQRLNDITERLATLGIQFSQNVLADENAFVLPLTDAADRDGLPPALCEAAAAAARERNNDADHVITLSRSLIEPFLTFSTQRHLREKAFKAWLARGENGGDTDNRDIIAEVLKLRQERARLLGFASFAAYKLDNAMAKTTTAVDELLAQVWTPAVNAAGQERARLAAAASRDGQNIDIQPWDWRFYAEKVRQADYQLDEAEVKAHLVLDNMIAAAFATANRLFALTFEERCDLDLYHPDVRAWEVSTADGEHVGLFLGDYFARPSKRSGAWMTALRGQRRFAGKQTPIIVNVLNIAKGEAGKPTLISFDDARTIFHEFGHALHGLLSDVTYGSLAGTSVERDFVELPSQLFEHWLESDAILSQFARHHETGQPMPDDLRTKLKAARNFNQGFATVEYLASALVDMAFHSPAYDADDDPIAFEARQLESIGMPPAIAMRHRSPHFQHIFAGDGYSAGYYSYMWSEVLDADAFAAFEEAGDVFDPETAGKLKTFVYAAGGRRDGDDAYLAFRGKLPTPAGLLRQRGLVDS